jgi:hypothetical protein
VHNLIINYNYQWQIFNQFFHVWVKNIFPWFLYLSIRTNSLVKKNYLLIFLCTSDLHLSRDVLCINHKYLSCDNYNICFIKIQFSCIFRIRVNKNRVDFFNNKNIAELKYHIKKSKLNNLKMWFLRNKKITFKGRRFEILLKIDEDKLCYVVVIFFNRLCFLFLFSYS